jgi:hypothetical protein
MVGGKISFNHFDGSKKSSWIMPDINGLIYTWGAVLATTLVLTGIIYGVTGIAILTPFVSLINFIEAGVGKDWAIGAMIGMTLLPSFVIVFIFRYNFTVIGPRRQFRYICRWL